MPDGDTKVGNVLYPVTDVARAMAFYRDGLGLQVKFQDGDRFAALDGGNVTFALVGGPEDVTSGTPAVSFKVADVASTIERLTGVGAQLVSPAADGPHETRAVLRDPSGNQFVVYAPLPR